MAPWSLYGFFVVGGPAGHRRVAGGLGAEWFLALAGVMPLREGMGGALYPRTTAAGELVPGWWVLFAKDGLGAGNQCYGEGWAMTVPCRSPPLVVHRGPAVAVRSGKRGPGRP